MKFFLTLFCIFILLFSSKGQTESSHNNANLGITLSLPWVNYYNYVNYYTHTSSRTFGFFGLGFSAYYKTEKQKTSVNISITEDLSSPIRINKLYGNEIKTNIGTTYFEVTQYRAIHENINFVYGFNIVNYNFRLASSIKSIPSFKKTDQTLGASIGLEYRFNQYYSVAAMYRPAIASFETDGKYRHLINLELRIDLDFKKKK
jgi:hypothetical protein